METGAKKKKIMIRVRDLRKEYRLKDDTVVALKRINLDIEQGEICCIFGTSGSGKSTLLNQLAGLEKPTYGDVYIRGVAVTRLSEKELAEFRQKHIGFVFQSYNLLPFMNAAENVAVPLMFRGVSKRERKSPRRYLKRLGSPTVSTTTPSRCRAVSSSASALPARLSLTPTWSLRTSRREISTPRPL